MKVKLKKKTIFLATLSLILFFTMTKVKDYHWIDPREIIGWTLVGIMISSFFIKEKWVGFMILGIFLLMFYFSCLINYSKSINKMGKPMVQNVLAFYKEYQHYPNLDESKILLKKAGCTHIRQKNYKESKNKKGEIYERSASYDCDYNFLTYSYSVSVGDLSVKHNRTHTENQPFRISFGKRKSRCSSRLNKDGTAIREDLVCYQYSCINLSH